MKFLVINGPNLNLTQFTEPGMEGQIDFNTLLDYIEAGCSQMDVQVDFFQSNHEGDRAALQARGSADISMPAPTLCSCSGWMAARRRTWCSK